MLKRLWLRLRRIFNPWLCNRCGKHMRCVTLSDVPAHSLEEWSRPQNTWMLRDVWMCDDHPDKWSLIM